MSTKKDYELAIDAYEEAEAEYKKLEQSFLEGDEVEHITKLAGGDPAKVKEHFLNLIQLLRAKQEELNIKLAAAKTAMRNAVVLSPLQWRGPEGSASTLTYKSFSVQSGTIRRFDPKSLLRGAARYGVLDRLLSLTSINKDGKEYRLVEQTWHVDYQNVLKWLKEQGLQAVIDGAYDEVEQTPRVSGAKPLAFFGDKVER